MAGAIKTAFLPHAGCVLHADNDIEKTLCRGEKYDLQINLYYGLRSHLFIDSDIFVRCFLIIMPNGFNEKRIMKTNKIHFYSTKDIKNLCEKWNVASKFLYCML